MSEREGFLYRWSKRKIEAIQSPAPMPASLVSPEGVPGTEAIPAVDAAQGTPVPTEEHEPFDLSKLPSIDDLTGESDVSAFLQKGVPDSMKNAAMRKVWLSNAFIRNDTGPVDYAWDFNNPDSIPGWGTLPGDFDVSAMVRKIMGDVEETVAPVPEPEVLQVGDGGAQENALLVQESKTESIADPVSKRVEACTGENSQHDAQLQDKLEDKDRTDLNDSFRNGPAEPVSAQFRKRHGGAVPL